MLNDSGIREGCYGACPFDHVHCIYIAAGDYIIENEHIDTIQCRTKFLSDTNIILDEIEKHLRTINNVILSASIVDDNLNGLFQTILRKYKYDRVMKILEVAWGETEDVVEAGEKGKKFREAIHAQKQLTTEDSLTLDYRQPIGMFFLPKNANEAKTEADRQVKETTSSKKPKKSIAFCMTSGQASYLSLFNLVIEYLYYTAYNDFNLHIYLPNNLQTKINHPHIILKTDNCIHWVQDINLRTDIFDVVIHSCGVGACTFSMLSGCTQALWPFSRYGGDDQKINIKIMQTIGILDKSYTKNPTDEEKLTKMMSLFQENSNQDIDLIVPENETDEQEAIKMGAWYKMDGSVKKWFAPKLGYLHILIDKYGDHHIPETLPQISISNLLFQYYYRQLIQEDKKKQEKILTVQTAILKEHGFDSYDDYCNSTEYASPLTRVGELIQRLDKQFGSSPDSKMEEAVNAISGKNKVPEKCRNYTQRITYVKRGVISLFRRDMN